MGIARAPLLLCTAAALALVVGLQELRPQRDPLEKVSFGFNEGRPTLPADLLSLISFGYPRLFSNLLWIRFLQAMPTDRVPKGEISWMYYDLDTITTIDPDFYPAFEHAGIYISVVTDDKLGARMLLEKGVKLHPSRWRIRAYLGYHYQFEVNEPDKSLEQYLAASKLEGAPPLMGLLAARQMARMQNVRSSVEFLEDMVRTAPDEITRKRFQERLDIWRRKLAEGEQR